MSDEVMMSTNVDRPGCKIDQQVNGRGRGR
jgi:hypothetical protein